MLQNDIDENHKHVDVVEQSLKYLPKMSFSRCVRPRGNSFQHEEVRQLLKRLSPLSVCTIYEKSRFHTSTFSNKYVKPNTLKFAYNEKFRRIGELRRQRQQQNNEPVDETPTSVKMFLEHQSKNEPAEKIEENSKDAHMSKNELMKRLASMQWDMSSAIYKSINKNVIDFEKEEKEIGTDAKEAEEKLLSEGFAEEIFLEEQKYKIKKPKIKVKTTSDHSLPISDIPCNGCGAFLHCQDHAVSGFLPSEKFKSLSIEELKETFCQRCIMIRNHNMHLQIKMPEDTFPKLFSRIKEDENCLVMLVIDLLDIPNSINKSLLEWVGKNQKFYIVGNKVDMIPKDGQGYLERVEDAVRSECISSGLKEKNIQQLMLVSGKTGYGIERLITKLLQDWKRKGDVFLIGNTNCGKSTLFNTLLRSDYCQTKARVAIKRATVSDWPGTTLSMLKFPIANMEPWKLFKRVKRFQKTQISLQQEMALRKSRAREGKYKFASLWGHVGITDFRDPMKIAKEEEELDTYSGFDVPMFEYLNKYTVGTRDGKSHIKGKKSVDYDPKKYFMSKWLYDTPGIESSQQIFSFLTQEELALVLPRHIIIPRAFLLHPQKSLYITGLSRVDYLQGKSPMYVTVFAAPSLPVHGVDLYAADDFYKDNIANKIIKHPVGDTSRAQPIPDLQGIDFDIKGENWWLASTDIQISSLGWFSVTYGSKDTAKIRVYTPGGRGIHMRQPSMHPNAVVFRGKRMKNTIIFQKGKPVL